MGLMRKRLHALSKLGPFNADYVCGPLQYILKAEKLGMKRFILALLLLTGGGSLYAQLASPFSNSIYPAQTFTASNQTGSTIQLNGLTSPSAVGSSYALGTLTVTGTSLTTVTFGVLGSSDNGTTYYPLPITSPLAAPGSGAPATTVTATSNGIYQIPLGGLTHVKIVTGTFTATAVSIQLSASPNAQYSKAQPSGGSGSGINQLNGDVAAGPGTGNQTATLAASGVTAGSYTNMNATVDAKGRVTAASNGAASGINQLTGDVTAGPGTGSQGATLAATSVNPGSYTSANITVDAKGRLTAASNGTAGGVTSFNTRTGPVTSQSGDYTATQVGALATANNLNDLASASTARGNLGLGSAATQPSSAFDAAGAATTAQTNAIAASLPRAIFTVGTGGVTANTIVSFDASGNAIAATGTGFGGLAAATVAASGTVEIVRSGIGTCVFDGAAVINDIAVPSTTTLGECHDSGVATSASITLGSTVIGGIESTVSGAGVTGLVRLHGPGAFGSNTNALPFVPNTATINGHLVSGNPVLTSLDIAGAGGAIVAGTSLYPNTTAQVYTGFNSWQTRIPFVPPATNDCYEVTWMNVFGTTETPGPALTIVDASIEYPAGTFYPLFFNGSRTGTLAPGALLVSDSNCIDTSALGVLYVRSLMQRTNPADTTLLPYNYAVDTGLTGSAILAPNTPDATGTFDGGEGIKVATYADGVANGTTTFTSATANFNLSYVGNTLTDARGPTTYTIATFVNTTTVTLSGSPATGTGLTFSTGATDKTTSGTIQHASLIQLLAPYALLGQPNLIKNVGLVGDSITWGTGSPSVQANGVSGINGYIGSWAVQAISQANLAAGIATSVMPNIAFTNVSMPTETCSNLTVKHQTRFALLGRARKTMGDLGINDINTGGVTEPTIANCMLTLWSQFARRGIAPYYSTLTPLTTSTDNWLTAGNQTPFAGESVRVAFNTWMRDGAPLDCATGLAAAAGSALTTVVRTNWYSNGALTTPASRGTAATCNHPAVAGGTFELANAVEVNSSNALTQNGGRYRADPGARVLTGCSSTASSSPTVVTCTSGTFTSGDVGRFVSYAATGVGPNNVLGTFIDATHMNLIANTTSSPSGITMTIDGAVETQSAGRYNNGDGIHPSYHGHAVMGAMAAAAPVAQWTF